VVAAGRALRHRHYQGHPPSAVAVSPTVMTASGCRSTPSEDLRPGLHTLNIKNDSASLANFELLRLSESFDVFDDFLVEARKKIDAGEPPPGELPHIEEEVSRKLLEPGDSGQLAGDLEPGIHAVICVVLDEHEDIVTVFATGPFVVTQ
jgi:hypothetical protein